MHYRRQTWILHSSCSTLPCPKRLYFQSLLTVRAGAPTVALEFPMAKKANLQKSPVRQIEKIAFVSLGCPKNLVDSERMLGLLAEDGLAITPDAANADAIVINTCGFLEASKTESMKEIHEAVQWKTDGKCQRVIVAGCLVQRHKTKLLADEPGIDRLVGVFDREHIVEAVRGKENPRQEHGHFLGKYHDLSRELAEQAKMSPIANETK